MRVLVAGASGAIGRGVVAALRSRGDTVRALVRRPRPAGALGEGVEIRAVSAARPGALAGVCDGMDAVVSCLGAPVSMSLGARASYLAVDTPANETLLDQALRANVSRFVYVSLHVEPAYAHTAYVRAHEHVVDRLRRADTLTGTVIRPTGLYCAMADFLRLARWGFAPLIGDGRARTNPVHEHEVAAACVDALGGGPGDVELGGPEVLTRRDIVELAFAALGKRPRLFRLPPGLFGVMGTIARPLHPRLGDLMRFFAAVASSDALAPARGTMRLSEYFAARVAAS